MKTLDEVIKAFEICDETVTANCPDCPYDLDCENVPGEDLRADALHYLKEYQRYQSTPSRNGHMALVDYFDELQKNLPLTWEELRTMQDKPVWWAHGEIGEWLTIYGVPKNDNNVIYATTCSGVECWIYKKDLSEFQYYRKEK